MKKIALIFTFILFTYAYCNAQFLVSINHQSTFHNQIECSDYESTNSFCSADLLLSAEHGLNKYLYLQYGFGVQNRNAVKDYEFGTGNIKQQLAYIPITINLKKPVSDKLSFSCGTGFSISSPLQQNLNFSQSTQIPASFLGIDGNKRFMKFTFLAQLGARYAIHEKFDVVSSLNAGYDIKALTANKNDNPAYFNTYGISIGLSYKFNR